jgi:hypothetical protein
MGKYVADGNINSEVEHLLRDDILNYECIRSDKQRKKLIGSGLNAKPIGETDM